MSADSADFSLIASQISEIIPKIISIIADSTDFGLNTS